jgi:spermidine/putrescine transport system ATP-binding protein
VEVAGLGRAHRPRGRRRARPTGDVAVGFRPETLTILYEGQQATDRESPGTVEEVVYYGDMTYYDVRLDGVAAPVRLSMRNVFGRCPVLETAPFSAKAPASRGFLLLQCGASLGIYGVFPA